jgi:hypothetical protein
MKYPLLISAALLLMVDYTSRWSPNELQLAIHWLMLVASIYFGGQLLKYSYNAFNYKIQLNNLKKDGINNIFEVDKMKEKVEESVVFIVMNGVIFLVVYTIYLGTA